jgi:hypothetical protein
MDKQAIMKNPVVNLSEELEVIRLCRGQVLTIILTDATNQWVDDGEMNQVVEIAVTHSGMPIIYADGLTIVPFDMWTPYEED